MTDIDKQNKIIKIVGDNIMRGQYSEALNVLNSVIEEDPCNEAYLYHIGYIYRMMNELDKAESYYKKALEVGKMGYMKDAIYYAMGIVYQLKEEFKSSIDMLQKAIDINEYNLMAYNSLGITYSNMGLYEKALEIYDIAREKCVEKIIEDYKESGGKIFDDATTEVGKKVAVLKQEYFSIINEGLKKKRDYSYLCSNKASTLADMGRISEAKELLKEAIEFIPEGLDFRDPYIALAKLERNTSE